MHYVLKDCEKKASQFIVDNLVKYNLSKLPLTQKEAFIWINKVIEDDNGNIVAGIICKMYCWNVLYIDTLWVSQEERKKGLGTMLIKEVERIARENSCSLIHLDTFDFQALDFYKKHGYNIFGVLEGYPKDHKRFFMKKNK